MSALIIDPQPSQNPQRKGQARISSMSSHLGMPALNGLVEYLEEYEILFGRNRF